VQVAQAVKAQLADVGVDMSVTPLESSAAIARRNGAEYEAATGTTEIGADPDGDVQPNVDPGRAARYNNPLVNDLVLKARSTADPPAGAPALLLPVRKRVAGRRSVLLPPPQFRHQGNAPLTAGLSAVGGGLFGRLVPPVDEEMTTHIVYEKQAHLVTMRFTS